MRESSEKAESNALDPRIRKWRESHVQEFDHSPLPPEWINGEKSGDWQKRARNRQKELEEENSQLRDDLSRIQREKRRLQEELDEMERRRYRNIDTRDHSDSSNQNRLEKELLEAREQIKRLESGTDIFCVICSLLFDTHIETSFFFFMVSHFIHSLFSFWLLPEQSNSHETDIIKANFNAQVFLFLFFLFLL